jgi:glutathione S-transferase
MITLYHCLDARSFRPLWMLEEMGLPYDLKMLPFPPRAHARQFLAINPLGTIPFCADGDTAMTESAAICQYLAVRYGPTPLDVRPEEPGFGAYLNWLHFGEATLTFPQTLVLRYGTLEPAERRQPQVVEDYRRWFLGRLRSVEAAVTQQDYLCAGRFTAADISVGYALMLAYDIGLAQYITPGVAVYWQRLKARPAWARAYAAQAQAAAEQGVPDWREPATLA